MATSSLLALIDDIASIMDDVSVLTKVAAQKTTGVLGDDLALNAQQVSGVSAERELPVVWAVCKGSFVNKAILVPAAIAISYFAPWLVTPLLMIGGAYLCFEGCEKLAHKYLHTKVEIDTQHDQLVQAIKNQRRYSHRFYFVGRDHRHHARHGTKQPIDDPNCRDDGHRHFDDCGRLWAGRWHCEN
jgi:uncharacterized protein